jgi:hypothetical protein
MPKFPNCPKALTALVLIGALLDACAEKVLVNGAAMLFNALNLMYTLY